MSNAVTATGTLLQRADINTPTVFTTVAELKAGKPPSFSRNEIDSTNHNDGAESKVLGILRQGNGTFSVNYIGNNATHVQIVSDIMNNTKAQWRFLLPSGVHFAGPGFIQKFELQEATVDSIQAADCAISWAGVVVQTVP